MKNPYEDMLDLERPITKHTPMSIHDRAAQFSSFAALVGHEEQIEEAAERNAIDDSLEHYLYDGDNPGFWKNDIQSEELL